jgi:lactoylglutathione lyase
MKLNHLNLTVTDVTETRAFLEKYFGLQGKVNPYTGESTEGGKQNRNFTVLFDDDRFVLTLMGGGKTTAVEYPGHFHIGFSQESEERVNELYRRLKDDGFDMEPPRRLHAWTFYVLAPGGFNIEATYRP